MGTRRNARLQQQFCIGLLEDMLLRHVQRRASATTTGGGLQLRPAAFAARTFKRALKQEAQRILAHYGCNQVKRAFATPTSWQSTHGKIDVIVNSRRVQNAVAQLLRVALYASSSGASALPMLPTAAAASSASPSSSSSTASSAASARSCSPPAHVAAAAAAHPTPTMPRSARPMPTTPPLAMEPPLNALKDELQLKLYSNLGKEDIAHAFCAFDSSRSGHISFEDFRERVRLLNVSGGESDIIDLFHLCDASANGVVSFKDFTKFMASDVKLPIFSGRPDTPPESAKRLLHKDDNRVLRALEGRKDAGQIVREKIEQRNIPAGDVVRAFHPPMKLGNPDTISLQDFTQGATHLGVILSEDDLKATFNKLPQVGPGLVSHHEFSKWLKGQDKSQRYLTLKSDRPGFRPELISADLPNLSDGHDRRDVLDQRLRMRFKSRGHIKRALALFEKSNKHCLNISEFKQFCRSIGMDFSKKDFSMVFSSLKPDSNGQIRSKSLVSDTFPSSNAEKMSINENEDLPKPTRYHHDNVIKKMGKHVRLEDLLLDKIEARATGHSILQRTFQMFDTSSSQDISLNEFKRGLDRIGMNVAPADCLELFAYFDSDKDGVINYREFVSNVMQRQPTEKKSMLAQMKNGDDEAASKLRVYKPKKVVELTLASEQRVRDYCQSESRRASLAERFRQKDRKQNGHIEFPDMVKVLRGISDSAEDCRPLFERFSENSDRQKLMNYEKLLESFPNKNADVGDDSRTLAAKSFDPEKLSRTRALLQHH